jgi:prepilin-type processing-associated H-X9-DG protein
MGGYRGSYGPNTDIIAVYTFNRIMKIKSPSTTLIIGERPVVNTISTPDAHIWFNPDESVDYSFGDVRRYKHSKMMNVLFFDLHVARTNREDSSDIVLDID